MKRVLFTDKTPEEIRELLEANADGVEDGTYTSYLEPDEISIEKDKLAETSVKLSRLEDEFAIIKKEYKDKMDPLKMALGETIETIQNGSRTKDGRLYLFKDLEERMLGKYDDKGELVDSRRLRPDEMQHTLQGGIRIAGGSRLYVPGDERRTGTND